MKTEEKQRIEKEAEQYLATCSHAGDDNNLKRLYIAGATCENERIAELLKEERKKSYDAIGKAYAELKKMGYGGDMNILAVMSKLQNQFK